MKMMKSIQINDLIPRHMWLKNRIKDCILAIQKLEEIQDWESYLQNVNDLAQEILYCSTEWEKYYER